VTGFLFGKIMSNQSYYEKLKSPQWQRKRLEIMQRDEFTCVSCGCKEKTLNVHHKTYRKNAAPWDYDDENFITYCEECHGSIHQAKDLLMSSVDTFDKIQRIASISFYCDIKHIKLAQIASVIAAIEKSEVIAENKDDFEKCIEVSEEMIMHCKSVIKYAKKKIKQL
jgi:hypothetical protein